MGEISPELVERMVALVRHMARDVVARDIHFNEARTIVAELPKPVDPDLIEAREVVCGYHHDKHPESPWHINQAARVRSGALDSLRDVQAAYHGIKRGRELSSHGEQ